MNDIKFQVAHLGQPVIRYCAPKLIVDEINAIYEKTIKKAPSWNHYLIGKINKEHSLFWDSRNESVTKKHNFLSKNILMFFAGRIRHYLAWNKVQEPMFKIISVWVNDMKAGEYNPVHVHHGDLTSGISAVMFLKTDTNYGKEISRDAEPMNGQLHIMGSTTGPFAKDIYISPQKIDEGDLFIFPYDVRHCVYPFKGKHKRRTLSFNADVKYVFGKPPK